MLPRGAAPRAERSEQVPSGDQKDATAYWERTVREVDRSFQLTGCKTKIVATDLCGVSVSCSEHGRRERSTPH